MKKIPSHPQPAPFLHRSYRLAKSSTAVFSVLLTHPLIDSLTKSPFWQLKRPILGLNYGQKHYQIKPMVNLTNSGSQLARLIIG